MTELIMHKMKQATVRVEGTEVLIFFDGQKVMDLPWDAALKLAKAMTIQARRIEEQVKALRIVADNAVLLRSGAPFGLSDDRAIIAESKKEALYKKDLRKYMPFKGITSEEAFGRPTIIQHKPKEENNGKD